MKTQTGKVIFFVVLFWTAVAAAQLQPELVSEPVLLDGKKVHPYRLLARLAEHKLTSAATNAAAGQNMRIKRHYGLVPGLVCLEEINPPNLAKVDKAVVLKQKLIALQKSPLFEFVEPDYMVQADTMPNDTYFTDGTLWGLWNYGQNGGVAGVDIEATNAWRHTTGSSDVIVAVVDTGIRYTHQDLAAQMWRNPGEIPGNGVDDDGNGYVDDVYGINAITGSGNPMDDDGHGTHVAGTIGAAANDGHPLVGVTWNVRLMACKFLPAGGEGATSDAIECIGYAHSRGAIIQNHSWGSYTHSESLLLAISQANQSLHVCAAGNDSNNNNDDNLQHFPSNYGSGEWNLPNVIAVAAIKRDGALAEFSNYGSRSVHLGAPGSSIYSSINSSDTSYDYLSGTSMAAPHVSGVAALVKAMYPGINAYTLRQYMLGPTATVPSPYLQNCTVLGGRLSAYRSLAQGDFILPAISITSWTNNAPITTFTGIGGVATDNFDPPTVNFSIQETDGMCEPTWWNGFAWQTSITNLPGIVTGTNWTKAPGVTLPPVRGGHRYLMSATAMDIKGNTTTASVLLNSAVPVPSLAWDPGQTPRGTQVLTNPDTYGGTYLFKISAQNTAVGAWRTALRVLGGEANVYMGLGSPPTSSSYNYASARVGSDGWVLHSSQFTPGQEWYILVCASAGAQWTLLSGEAYVYDTGQLSPDVSSSTNVIMLPEGMAFFKTTIPSDTLAWRLWLNGATNTLYVKKSVVPHPVSYELIQNRQMLVVQPYLATNTFSGYYFVCVPGDPDTPVKFDSRKQAVTDIPFNSLTNVTVPATNDYPYVTFRVQVPVQQIAWQLNLFPTNGLPNIAARRDYVPNEFRNDAYSETPTNVGASISLVPPGLSDGTFFVTIYSTSVFGCAFANGNPTITDVDYTFRVTNDAPNRAGWRYYRVWNVAAQLGSLGWELMLSNQVPGTEIALRRNAVPSRWYRRDNDNIYYSQSQGYVDYSGTDGYLQRPGHQADIWYIGIYTPTQALGAFVLSGTNITGTLVTFDGGMATVINQPAGRWKYFRVDVPADALGWDLRLVGVSSGNPQMVMSRDTLPTGLGTSWGHQWDGNTCWTGCGGSPMLTMPMGNPLQTGTYYIGVLDTSGASSYTLRSRGIGLTNYAIRLQTLSFDGGTSIVANQPAREWKFYQVVVPTNVLGWDVRLVGVTSGNPLMVVCRDTLPNGPFPEWDCTIYFPGYQWDGGENWTGCGGGPMLAMGVGYPQENPLAPGTYYIGVLDACNVSSYTVQSRGIGTNQTIRVRDLPFVGSITNSALAVGEADYYRVVVPSNAPDWKLQLHATAGDVLLKVQRDYLPNTGSGGYGCVQSGCGGQLMMKPGDEQWILLPYYYNNKYSATNLLPGTYYVVVASQGQGLTNNCQGPGSGLGTGSSGYVLSSGIEPVTLLPDTLSSSQDLVFTNAQAGGEMKFYQFNVPPGVASIEIYLENRVGNPEMYLSLSQEMQLVAPSYYYWFHQGDHYLLREYGNWGGICTEWYDASLFVIPSPQTGTYSLSVYASSGSSGIYSNASYVLRIHAESQTPLPFDGGMATVTNQPAEQWRIFRVDVPTNVLGWDVRLVGVTNGNPQMVVCRDTSPNGPYTTAYWIHDFTYPWNCTNWPSGYQWQAGPNWTGCGGGAMLAMGMGNPLEPGTYYIGVIDFYNVSSYTVQSRGIGTNQTIRVRDLPFVGSITNSALAVGEADYYRVVVPSNAPDWKLQLHATAGDVLLKVQRDYPPNNGDDGYGSVRSQKMMKPGDEQWVLMPEDGTNVAAGTYYVLVASQGQNPTNNCLGSGSAGYVLNSGIEPVTVFPDTLSYGHDLVFTNAQAGGEMKFYQFNVPLGTASFEVRLENRVGNPRMNLKSGAVLVRNTDGSGQPDDYGFYGGTYPNWYNTNLISVPNPQPGPYSLSVYVSRVAGVYSNASYIIRIHAGEPVSPLPFDGGTATVTNQPVAKWRFFRVDVPTNVLGWDVRLVGVTNGNPQMVVSRDTLPGGLGYTWAVDWFYYYYSWGFHSQTYPWNRTAWPSGYCWSAGNDWTGCGGGPMLAMGMAHPLEAGTYYIGVQDPNNLSSYTVLSRGIGTNQTIRVRDLPFVGSTTNSALAVSEADYYRVVVPSNAPDWKLQLHATTGDVLLKIMRNLLPNSGYLNDTDFDNRAIQNESSAQLKMMMKPGDEQWLLMPENGSNVTAGTYYVLVASQGQGLTNNCQGPGSGLGTGSAGYELSSRIEPVTLLPDTLSYGHDLVFTNAQAGGEAKFYRFNVPAGIVNLEVRLENRTGNPVMLLANSTELVYGGPWYDGHAWDDYGRYGNGGTMYHRKDANLITLLNLQSGAYSLTVYGAPDGSGNYLDASYVLRVRAPVIPSLNISSELNTNGLTNVVSGILADSQEAFSRVMVPEFVAGAPVLGWKLDLSALNGTPSLGIRKDLLPESTAYTAAGSVVIVPPYLTPGTWYVEVKGGGYTEYSLASSAITTNTLDRAIWTMPSLSQTNMLPGLSLPIFGDTGINDSGDPLPGDQGVSLEQGRFHFYAVLVPTNNAGLLRTELQAISGNPNLYLRVGNLPTLSHYLGDWQNPIPIYDRSLTGSATEYGNWVPLSGRTETNLTPGLWFLSVHAAGNANIRYRLILSCGNTVANRLVQNLTLNGGSVTNQNLNAGDWRYYRVYIPDPAPANWQVTWTRSLGSARMFVRDTLPPGEGSCKADYSNPNYNPNPIGDPYYAPRDLQNLQTWSTDWKNQGPYPRFDTPGVATMTTPPLRPGHTYYLGFWSPTDTTFSLSSSTSGGMAVVSNTIAFYGASITNVLTGHGSARYRMNVPPEALRIVFGASNSENVVLSLEQGTIAQPGGPAHWTSYLYNRSNYPNQTNVSLNQPLAPTNWPWQPGRTYYFTVTNTSAGLETLGVNIAVPADLLPVRVIAPTNVAAGGRPQIQVVWGVTNQGLSTANGGWSDRVWFSTNGVLDGNSVSLGTFPFNSNAPVGGSYWRTNTVTLPMTNNGNYTLFVQVDINDVIYELNEVNNVSPPVFGTYTLTPPDLMPVVVVAPMNVVSSVPRPRIQVAWAVTNQGFVTTSGGWSDRVWFSTNGVLDGNSVSLGTFAINQNVPVGGSYCLTNTVTLPMTNSGNYWLFVQVDIENSQYELNLANNFSTAVPRHFILTPPDLVPVMILAPTNVVAGPLPQIQIAWGVTNQGVGTATGSMGWYDRVWYSTNGVLDGDSVSLGQFDVWRNVAPGESYWRTNTVTLPMTNSGSFWLFIQVDCYNHLVESSKTNNLSVPFAGLFNLWALPLGVALNATNWVWTTGGDGPWFGQTNVTHDGVAAAQSGNIANSQESWMETTVQGPGQLNFWWTVSSDGYGGIFGGGDRLWFIVDGAYKGCIGGNYKENWGWQEMSYNILQGSHTLRWSYYKDSSGSYGDDAGWVDEVKLTTLPADLAPVRVVIAPTNVVSRRLQPEIQVVWGVTNQGVVTAFGGWSDRVWFSTNGVLDGNSVSLGDFSFNEKVPVGGSYWRTNTVTLPMTNSGNYCLFVQADYNNNCYELNQSNNVSGPVSGRFTIGELPLDVALNTTNLVWTTGGDAPWFGQNLVTHDGVAAAESGGIIDGQESWMEAVIQGPGVLKFWWKVSSEWDDYLEFYIDGTLRGDISDYLDWQEKSFPLSVGSHTLRWRYVKDSSWSGGDDAGWVDEVRILPAPPLGMALNATNFVWLTSGDAEWFSQNAVTHDGTAAAQSGNIADSQESWMETTVQGPGVLKFWWKVSSEEYRDYSYFYIDGSWEDRTSGEWDWEQYGYILPAGSHTLRWSYEKNAVGKTNGDAVWVDEVQFTLASNLPDLAPIAMQVPATIPGPCQPEVTLVYGVTNQGRGTAESDYGRWYDEVYFSTNAVLDSADTYIGYGRENEPVSSGGSYWRTNTVRSPAVQSGTYYLIFKTDYDDDVWESDESNNVVVVPVTFNLLPPPDLAPISFQAPTIVTGPPLPYVTFVWGVTNQGTGPLGQSRRSWTDQVYLSTNAVLDSFDARLNYSYEYAPMAAGGSYRRTNTACVPVTQSGNYHLIFKTDYYNDWYESNESNNVVAVPVTFILRPVRILDLAEALNAANFVWTTGGNAPWFGQDGVTHDGVAAAQSGLITNNQESWIETIVSGPGTISFWWKVYSGDYSDYLEFYLDGIRQSSRISGNVDWQRQSFALGSGNHTLRWRYMKDGYGSTAPDAGWVDEVIFVPSVAPFRIAATVLGSGQMRLQLNGQMGLAYSIQASTDLINWVTLTNVNLSITNLISIDLGTAGYRRRFYRAVYPPLTIPIVQPFRISSATLVSNRLQMVLSGQTGLAYSIQYSPNLLNWTTLANLTLTNANATFTEPNPISSQRRYYRAVTPPVP